MYARWGSPGELDVMPTKPPQTSRLKSLVLTTFLLQTTTSTICLNKTIGQAINVFLGETGLIQLHLLKYGVDWILRYGDMLMIRTCGARLLFKNKKGRCS